MRGLGRYGWLGTWGGQTGVALLLLALFPLLKRDWLFAALLIVVGLSSIGYARRLCREGTAANSADEWRRP